VPGKPSKSRPSVAEDAPLTRSRAERKHPCRKDTHGPYYEWSHLKAGKLRHRTLSPEQAELMSLPIANHRKVKKLLRAWEVQTQRLIELNAPQ